MTDFRALCAELVDDLELCDWPYKLKETIRADIDRARAALADGPAVPDGREPASVTGQPSDEELLGIACQSIEPYDKIRPGEYEAENECAIEVYGSELVTFARAVLARWGNPAPQPPAGGEVEELILRVQRLEAMRETEKAALLDAFKQIDDLKHRIDFHYMKIYRLEDALPLPEKEMEG